MTLWEENAEKYSKNSTSLQGIEPSGIQPPKEVELRTLQDIIIIICSVLSKAPICMLTAAELA